MLRTTAIALLIGAAGVNGNVLWSSSPAGYGPWGSNNYLLKSAYVVGNGKLGAVPFGPPGAEKINLNVDSLWSGGPFEVEDYRGGNPSEPVSGALPEIRANIFENGTGGIKPLLGNRKNYGSNRVLGNLTINFEGASSYTAYRRELDLSNGIHKTKFVWDDTSSEVTASLFCSYPDQVCIYHLVSEKELPAITVGFENQFVDASLLNGSCGANVVRHSGVTQLGPPEGMRYAAVARVKPGSTTTTCLDSGELKVTSKTKELAIVISAETNYDQKAGNAENDWSFKGEDPGPIVEKIASAAGCKSYKRLRERHDEDYNALASAFTLELPDPQGSKETETAKLVSKYVYDGPGDPFLENLLFDYARHLLISSSRENSLPANLQGRWTELLKPSWGADYHSNINIQMNYWPADQTGLSSNQQALWNYIQDTWVPRGTETARLLYNASGWVTHNEMNTFGFTAMKDQASWANYPASGAWMMQHVWDTFDYTRDEDWFKTQGYPLIKGVAKFWVSSLQKDAFFEDGSLVVNPCNSPEHGPTSFGCVHYQQLIHQVFDSILAAQQFVSDADSGFVEDVRSSLEQLDTGLHFASWGGIKEWKLPEKYGFDGPNTHRHLSNLNGWHPGYSISSFANGYTNSTIQDAVAETLISRGMGNAEDANAGWAKVWRSACWARLNNTDKAYDELRYAIEQNFAPNGLSMYSGRKPPFQIDANFGFAGAVLSMLIVDLPLPHDAKGDDDRVVVLGPAIPVAWGNGKVSGMRLRGGGVVNFSWNEKGIVDWAKVVSKSTASGNVKLLNVEGTHLADA